MVICDLRPQSCETSSCCFRPSSLWSLSQQLQDTNKAGAWNLGEKSKLEIRSESQQQRCWRGPGAVQAGCVGRMGRETPVVPGRGITRGAPPDGPGTSMIA